MPRVWACATLVALSWCGAASLGDDGKTDSPKAGYAGLQVKPSDDGKGILVLSVLVGSPADTAGLQIDDLILRLNGQEVGTLEGFVRTIRGFKPGDKVQFRLRRGEEEKDVTVVLGEAPAGIDK